MRDAEYTTPADEIRYGDLFTVKEYLEMCQMGGLIDYDGYGNPVKDGFIDKKWQVVPSRHNVPKDATHVLWFNR